MKKNDGVIALIVCAIGWSTAGVFMKFVNINSFAMAGFRSLFAFITLAILSKRLPRFVIRKTAAENSTGEKSGKNEIDKRRTFYLWMSALSYSLTMILFCVCNKLTYSANAVLLQYTDLIWVILAGPLLLGEKNSKIDYIAIFMVVAGMILFFADAIFGTPSGEFSQTQRLGNIIALISGVTFGFTTLFQRKQQIIAKESGASESEGNSSSDAFMIAQIITALFGLPFVFIFENGIPDAQSIVFLLLLGIVQMGIPNITYAIGIKKVRALSASLITMLEPLMNPIWVLIFVGEIPSASCIAGGVIIMVAIALREVMGKGKEATE